MSSVVEHVLDLIPAYSLDILDEAEARQVSEHLEICAGCRAELRAYRQVVNDLPLGVLQVNPPPYLKDRIMQQARQTQPSMASESRTPAAQKLQPKPEAKRPWWLEIRERFSFGAPVLGLVSLALVLLLGASNLFLWQRLDRVQTQYQQVTDQYQNTLRTVPMKGTQNSPGATGLLVISKDGEHGTLVVDRLPVLDETQQYQLWLIRDGKRTSGGVFSVDKDGYGAIWISSPDPLSSYPAYGVTIEPAGGSPGPTGDKVLGGEL